MKLLFKKLMFFLPLPLAIIGINFFVEKTMFIGPLAHDAARSLLSGYNIANAYTCGDALIKEFYAQDAPTKKDVLVFGSSRSLGITKELFSAKTFFNMSVTGGRLGDFVRLYSLWRNKGLIPAYLIVGVDETIFRKGSNQDVVQSKPIIDLVSIDLFRYNLQCILNYMLHRLGLGGIDRAYPTKETLRKTETMLTDGSINYGKIRRSRTVAEINNIVVETIKKQGFPRLNDFYVLDADKVQLFETFIEQLLHDHVSIILLLTPIHPKAYGLLQKTDKYPLVCKVRTYLVQQAQKHHLTLLGDFDPAKNALDDADFFDEFHPKLSAMQKIFKPLKI